MKNRLLVATDIEKMITQKTVFILGAGASIPYHFPSGKDLVTKICNMLSDDSNNNRKLFFVLGFRQEIVQDFRKTLLQSGQSSVDAFLEHRTEFIDVGKVAIAMALLPLEKTNRLFDDTNSEKWYQYLFGILNTSFEKFGENNLSVITFNYDRSFEHYLFSALKNSHGRIDKDCAEKLSSIPIIHVHGKLGDFEWEQDCRSPVPYDLNEPLETEMIARASKKIKIIHENIEEDVGFKQARQLISEATRIYFLGFGFNSINLNRLTRGLQCRHVEIGGTMYKTSLQTKLEARKIIKQFCPHKTWSWEVLFPNKTIYEFLYNDITL